MQDIGPIMVEFPELERRLLEMQQKRQAREGERLQQMLAKKAEELGVSVDSPLMVKIAERAEKLVEASKLSTSTAEVMAALKIQRMYRGMIFRK